MPVRCDDYLLGVPADRDGVLGGFTLPGVFAAAADRDPDSVAIIDQSGSLTWRQWRAEVDALARGLQEAGVGPGDVVAVRLPNCADFETVHLAVAAAGAVMMPVHVGNGSAEVLGLLTRVDPAAVVLSAESQQDQGPLRGEELLARFPSLRAVVIAGDQDPAGAWPAGVTDGAGAWPAGVPDEAGAWPAGVLTLDGLKARWRGHAPRPVDLRPDMPFVLLPSSGTTSARPKICVHSHDGLLSNTSAVVADGADAFRGMVVVASALTHLFGLQAMYSALFTSCGQALPGPWDLDRFLAMARRVDPTVIFAVPTQLHDIVGGLRGPGRVAGFAPREVRTAGAALPAALADEIRDRIGAAVVVVWGMSEIGYGTHTRAGDPPEVAARSIGRPARGSAVRILDSDGQPGPAGVPGELQYQGAGMFRGYYGEPDLTRAAITADGWLRTGDMAARADDGLVTFCGRSAELINVGGQKFNAAEIQTLLAGLPGLGPVAVAGKPDPRLGEYPCLVVTAGADGAHRVAGADGDAGADGADGVVGAAGGGDGPDLAAVTAFLRERGVAEYKIPLEMVVLDELPRTPVGKLDRRALEAMLRSPADPADPGPGGTSGSFAEALALVRGCTATLLGLDPDDIAPDATFRSQGVNSLLAIRLGHQLAEATTLPLPASLAFDFPTPIAVAHLLSGEDTAPAAMALAADA